MIIIYIFLLLNILNNIHANLTEVILTKSGPVQGYITQSEDGLVHRFMSIPYASVDPDNKFGDPKPVKPWKEVYQADKDPVYCPQFEDEILYEYVGEINCQVLNVYTPKMSSRNEKLPVIFYIHGGTFIAGQGGPKYLGPEKLVRYDVILVTINYRLGPYGFMCLGDDQVPGNAGAKDTYAALRWVVENIEAFGGDVTNITPFGDSAGASMSEIISLAPASRNLCHKVILEGGTILPSILSNDYAFNRETTNKLANTLGFQNSNSTNVIKFLSSVPPLELIAAHKHLSIKTWPCLEVESETAFFFKQPIEFFLADDFEPTPIIFCVTNKEAMTFLEQPEIIEALIEAKSPRLENYFPELLADVDNLSFVSNDDRKEVAKIVRQFYFGDDAIDLDRLFDVSSDVQFVHPIDSSVSRYTKKSPGSVYYCIFAYDGDRNYAKHLMNLTYSGAGHADQLGYLFTQSFMVEITDRDRVIMDRMTTMWSNFVKYGDPMPQTNELLPLKWLPVEENVQNYLRIDTNMSSGKRAFSDRMAFWDLIYKNYATPLPSTAGNDAFKRKTSVIGLFLLLQASLLLWNIQGYFFDISKIFVGH